MAHVLEPASSGRSKCRGCGQRIAAGELRLGESLPNPFADGEMVHWFHPACAAYKRPEPLLELLETATTAIAEAERLASEAKRTVAHHRLRRIAGAERSPSSRAACRSCRANIDKGAWRIALVFYEDGRFEPAGFVHVTCVAAYFETADVLARVTHFSPALSDDDVKELSEELQRATR